MKNIVASVPRKEVEFVYGLYTEGRIEDAIKQIKILNQKSTKLSSYMVKHNMFYLHLSMQKTLDVKQQL